MEYQAELTKDLDIRLQKIQQEIRKNNADACILTGNVNIFYVTGMVYTGYCYIPAEGKSVHFVKRPNGVIFENTIYIRKPEQIGEELEKAGYKKPQTLLVETDSLSYSECKRLLAAVEIENPLNASVMMRKVRSIKTDFELSQVRLCAKQHAAVYSQIASVFRRGMTDVELQIEIERLMRLHGSLGLFRSYGENMDIYMGSLLVGENAEAPSPFDFALGGNGIDPSLPLGAANIPIKEGQTIMVDMAGNYKPWMTDMTRVFSVGSTTELAYKAHQVSIEIHDIVSEMAKPGTACADLYNKSLEIVKQNNLEEYFMGTTQQAKFVGHGVGLEINEPPVLTPRSKEILEPNIVYALEPKFVIPHIGAVGIENTYIVNENGSEKVTVFEENIIEL